MKNLPLFLTSLTFISCQSAPETKKTLEYVEPINETVTENDITVPDQPSVINETNLESSNLGHEVLFHYSQGVPGKINDSLAIQLQDYCTKGDIIYQAFETDDNKGLVHIKDELFFDLQKYMIKSHNGIVAVKENRILFIDISDQSVNIDSNINKFFQKR
jgi:hypothetical protein